MNYEIFANWLILVRDSIAYPLGKGFIGIFLLLLLVDVMMLFSYIIQSNKINRLFYNKLKKYKK